MSKLDEYELLLKAHSLLDRLADLLPAAVDTQFDNTAIAYRWRGNQQRKYLRPISEVAAVRLDDLHCIDWQKRVIRDNTRQFIHGLPANNVLLWGAKGTGKSSLIKALLNDFAHQGLRLIEVDRHDLVDLPDIIQTIKQQKFYYIVFCDDLSFEAEDSSYKSLKVVLDGSICNTPDNFLIYATSNRRHILPEYMQENAQTEFNGNEIHQSDASEEKISLSERFGLWLSFHPFNQKQYLQIVDYCLARFGTTDSSDTDTRAAALRWALERGSRSGRVAWQFAKSWTGKQQLDALQANTTR